MHKWRLGLYSKFYISILLSVVTPKAMYLLTMQNKHKEVKTWIVATV